MSSNNSIAFGKIIKVDKTNNIAQVQTSENEGLFDIPLQHLFGLTFYPKTNTRCVILKPYCKFANAICIPADLPSFLPKLPLQDEGDFTVGNPYSGCKIVYKESGDIEIEASGGSQKITIDGKTIEINGQDVNITTNNFQIDATQVKINGSNIQIGGATALALNQNAQILDSLGLPCTITNAGQTNTII